MRRAGLVAALGGALALGIGAVAFGFVSAKDRVGDVKHDPPGKDSRYDLVALSADQNASGQLVDTVKVKGKVRLGGPSAPLLWIDVPGTVSNRPGCQFSDYFVAGGEVEQCGEGPTTGDATVTKLNAHKVQFTFAPAAIGSPATYGIAFVTEGPNATATKLLFFDRAPNKGFLVSPIS